MRVPSGGRLASGVLVRTMIQCPLSQDLAGKVSRPEFVNVAPACSSMVSPQLALSSAACRSPPKLTLITAPGAGVFARVVFKYTRGNSAGPSKLLVTGGVLAGDTVKVKLRVADFEAASVTFAVKA